MLLLSVLSQPASECKDIACHERLLTGQNVVSRRSRLKQKV